MNPLVHNLKLLAEAIDGDLFMDETTRLIYATDASAYREKPLAVVWPRNPEDLKKIIAYARENNVSVIPRTAGTSLAGQVVGGGIVVDVSRYFTGILEFNPEERRIRVEPGVVLDELNKFLKPYGLFFGPETSTSNRCMIGGMVGNNACGAHSILYGSTRDHILGIKAILSDGSEVWFGTVSPDEFEEKCKGSNLENHIYRKIKEILEDPENQAEIRKEYPDKSVHRRNTGYAIDILLETKPFGNGVSDFNLCKLLAGSEGTLAFSTEIMLTLVPLPPAETGLVCVHHERLEEAFEANLIALKHNPGAVELLDKTILDLTKDNIEQRKNRFFLKGDPAVILIVEFQRETREEILQISNSMESDLRDAGYGYHFPVLFGDDITKVWNLRKAGLGVLSNMKGDAKPVPLCEDTAVPVKSLPAYMNEFREILTKYNKDCVYYAHIGSGELHIRPILNLKEKEDIELFHTIGREMALLVKKYNGSLSGEHGDGRLRGEFIPIMIGENNYRLLKEIKAAWDPFHVFNPGKIVDTPRMNTFLRYKPGQVARKINTVFDFSDDGGILRAAEKCNGSGDCRKTEIIGGTMCPSYMATRDEHNTTRARANLLREILTNSEKPNPFDSKALYEILDLCLSCKGCKSECPSSIDIAKMKAEFLQNYYDAHSIPVRAKLVAYMPQINRIGAVFPLLFNFFIRNRVMSGLVKKVLGIAEKRQIPGIYRTTLRKWMSLNTGRSTPGSYRHGRIVLFVDEFTDHNDTEIGIKAFKLMTRLGYEVICPSHEVSGRTFISKGLLRAARKKARRNIEILSKFVSDEVPMVGIEPSAILCFRDEYPDLAGNDLRDAAEKLANHTFMLEEFLIREIESGHITHEQFTEEPKQIKFHGHCQQKSIASTESTVKLLSFPLNYSVEEISSGCCGMAGSFGFEKEHYDLSM
ncbi:MAG: FAD-binding protein, partial [Bacteroidales bacterium]